LKHAILGQNLRQPVSGSRSTGASPETRKQDCANVST